MQVPVKEKWIDSQYRSFYVNEETSEILISIHVLPYGDVTIYRKGVLEYTNLEKLKQRSLAEYRKKGVNMNKAQKRTKINQEGYGLGVTREDWDDIQKEGDGYAVTAWGVVENGKVVPWNIHPTRELARQEQKELTGWDDDNRYSVRKLEIRVVEGR